jgi:hypothetical protein
MDESSPKRQRTASNIVSLDIVSRGLSLVDGNGNGLLLERKRLPWLAGALGTYEASSSTLPVLEYLRSLDQAGESDQFPQSLETLQSFCFKDVQVGACEMALLQQFPLSHLALHRANLQFSSLPDLNQLTRLELFDCSCAVPFDRLPNLEHLNVQWCEPAVPNNVWLRSPQLKVLFWLLNDALVIAESFSNLILNRLSLSNHLNGDVIFSFLEPTLTSLRLVDSALSQINRVGTLVNLTRLQLSDNRIAEIPIGIGALTQLRMLDLGQNRIQNLPDQLGLCAALERLDLSDNKICTLPNTMHWLTNLKQLRLSDNRLASVEQLNQSAIPLQRLGIEGNAIASLDLSQLDQLKRLRYCGNPTDVHALVLPTNLDFLSISCSALPSSICSHTALQDLHIRSPDGKPIAVPVDFLKLAQQAFVTMQPCATFLVPKGPRFAIPNRRWYASSVSLEPLRRYKLVMFALCYLSIALDCDMPILEAIYLHWQWRSA